MSEEVTKIIDTLCEKLGVAADYLIPELAKKNIAQDSVVVFLSLIVAVLSIIFMKCLWKNSDDDEDFFSITILILLFFVLVISVVCFAFNVVDLAGWIASPTAMGIQEISCIVK